jgi:hypothetical protein
MAEDIDDAEAAPLLKVVHSVVLPLRSKPLDRIAMHVARTYSPLLWLTAAVLNRLMASARKEPPRPLRS